MGFPLTGVPAPVGAGDGVKGPGTVVAGSAALAASREAGSTRSMSLLDSQPLIKSIQVAVAPPWVALTHVEAAVMRVLT